MKCTVISQVSSMKIKIIIIIITISCSELLLVKTFLCILQNCYALGTFPTKYFIPCGESKF